MLVCAASRPLRYCWPLFPDKPHWPTVSEATLKAQPGGMEPHIFFHNVFFQAAPVYWLDETGQRKLKAVVEAGENAA